MADSEQVNGMRALLRRFGPDRAARHDAAAGTAAMGKPASAPWILRNWRYTELKFTGSVTQSRMLTFRPWHLLVDYTRTMLGVLWFRPDARMVGMIGLGGGSQAKFIHRLLPDVRLEVVENSAEVIAMRRRFRIPDDDARLQIMHGDGAEFVRERIGRYDALLIDAYDPKGIPSALSTQRWYDDCRNALNANGVMASNLYAADAQAHIDKLVRSFGRRNVLVLSETAQSNRVVFAWKGEPPPAISGSGHEPRLRVLPSRFRREMATVFERLNDGIGHRQS